MHTHIYMYTHVPRNNSRMTLNWVRILGQGLWQLTLPSRIKENPQWQCWVVFKPRALDEPKEIHLQSRKKKPFKKNKMFYDRRIC